MASQNVVELTTENWEQEVLKSEKPVLVDFWAPWCAPCRQLLPTIDRLADQFAGKVKVGKLNVDESQDIAAQWAVMGIPQVLVFQGDQLRERVAGLTSEQVLAKMLRNVLETGKSATGTNGNAQA
jgi:thioredoxin 1